MMWANFSKPWQPLTPKGAAAFVAASLSRLYVVLLCFAAGAGCAVMFFLNHAVSPVLAEVAARMPEGAVLSRGEIFGVEAPVSAARAFLSLDVDTATAVPDPRSADVQLRFHRNGWKACSLLGCLERPYPSEMTAALGASHLGPKWAAWRPLALAVTGVVTVLWLLATWTVVATLYCLPVWIAAFFADRAVGLAGSWKIAAAGLMPGCALMTAGIVLYAVRVLDLPGFAMATAAHFVVGWIFIGLALGQTERKTAKPSKARNPFAG